MVDYYINYLGLDYPRSFTLWINYPSGYGHLSLADICRHHRNGDNTQDAHDSDDDGQQSARNDRGDGEGAAPTVRMVEG